MIAVITSERELVSVKSKILSAKPSLIAGYAGSGINAAIPPRDQDRSATLTAKAPNTDEVENPVSPGFLQTSASGDSF
jgi:hypothetical protein